MDNGNIDDAIKLLLSQNPRGFSISSDGRVTPMPDTVQIRNLDELSELVTEPKEFAVPWPGGNTLTLKIRGLKAEEAAEIDKIGSDLRPPKRVLKPAMGGKPAVEEFDHDDAGYRKQRDAYWELRRAALISKGLVGIDVPGESLEKKSEYLRSKFPPRIIDALDAAIRALTSDPIEQASFISSAA
jgi:hypothetical protein